MARTERYVIEDTAVLAKGDLAVSAAVEVIKNWPGESATSQRPEVINTDDVGRCHSAFRSSHWAIEFRTDLPKQEIIQKSESCGARAPARDSPGANSEAGFTCKRRGRGVPAPHRFNACAELRAGRHFVVTLPSGAREKIC